MNTKHEKLNVPFSVEYTISFVGKTKSDGQLTITAQIIRDKVISVLEKLLQDEFISEYTVSAQRNNLKKQKGAVTHKK